MLLIFGKSPEEREREREGRREREGGREGRRERERKREGERYMYM